MLSTVTAAVIALAAASRWSRCWSRWPSSRSRCWRRCAPPARQPARSASCAAPARRLGRREPARRASRPRRLAAARHRARHATPGRHRVRLARGGHRHAEPRVSPRRRVRLGAGGRIALAGAPHRIRRAAAQMRKPRGFTLIELLTALLILSLLALMSYRGLGAVLDAREHVRQETEKWRSVAAFFARFERDVQLAAPRPVLAARRAAPRVQPLRLGRGRRHAAAGRLPAERQPGDRACGCGRGSMSRPRRCPPAIRCCRGDAVRAAVPRHRSCLGRRLAAHGRATRRFRGPCGCASCSPPARKSCACSR